MGIIRKCCTWGNVLAPGARVLSFSDKVGNNRMSMTIAIVNQRDPPIPD